MMRSIRFWQIVPLVAMLPLTFLAVDFPSAALVPTILLATCCAVNVVAAVLIDIFADGSDHA